MIGYNEQSPPEYLRKIDASFLIGEVSERLSACNILASLHIRPGHLHMANESVSFTYVSHSIKEFFSNLQKVPEDFNNAAAYHLCVDTRIAWDGTNNNQSRTFDLSSDAFKPVHGSGFDDLAKEIIKNVTTHAPGSNNSRVYLGSYITEGYTACDDPRFDWEQNGQMRNLTKVAGMTGTDMTKQWLNISHADGITKLGMACLTNPLSVATGRTLPDNAGVALLSRLPLVQALCALFAAILIMTCA